MSYLIIKAAISGAIAALVSGIARRSPGSGALVASLTLVSLLGVIWLRRGTRDVSRTADRAQATFRSVLPSMPMFLLAPWLLGSGIGFWPSIVLGCLPIIALYFAVVRPGPIFGLNL